MTTSWRQLTMAVALVAPLTALAVDSPHDASYTSGSCTECHALHIATGGSGQPTPATVCMDCHTRSGKPARVNWRSGEQAIAGSLSVGTGTTGSHHNWERSVTSAAADALPPEHPLVAQRTPGGVLQCATCHDLHKANAANAPNSVSSSLAVGTGVTPSSGGTGRTLTLTTLPSNARAAGYRVKITTGNTFIVSHDFGKPPAQAIWYAFAGGVWTAGVPGVEGVGKPFTLGTPVTVDNYPAASNPNPISVTFAGAPAAGDFWDFYVSYPFVRAFNAAGEMCVDCHRDRAQDHYTTRGSPGYGWGGKAFSHPVYQAPNDNGGGYDRAVPLDANGAVQGGAGDGNKTNDLVLQSGLVTCITCHSPHGADSNSLTVDLLQ
jgi:cytochrome c553